MKSQKSVSIPSLVRVDGERDIIFPTMRDGETYFMKKKKELKETLTLIALYKKVDGQWIGVRHN